MTGTGRGGFALASVLLALLLLSSLALMSSLAARAQAVNAGVGLRVSAAETAAYGAIEAQIARTTGFPSPAPGGFDPHLGNGVVGGIPWSVADYRVDDEFHVLIGSAPIGDTGSRARNARLVWWMDPARRVAGHRATIESLDLVLAAGALVSGDQPLGQHDDHAACAHRAPLASAFPSAVPEHGPLPDAPEWGSGEHPGLFGAVRLGWFGSQALTDLADVLVSGPAASDECPTCWMGVVTALGPTSLTGSGSGVLVAQDQLLFEAGAHWSGLVLVAGDLQLEEGATVTGLVRSGGVVTLADSASVTASVCAAYRSLSAARTLLHPRRIPAATRLGPVPSGFD